MTDTPSEPTDAELAVLRVLWARGPLTVRQVHERLYRGTDVGYTTTLKLLQNLHSKRLVRRDEQARQHVYHAAVGADETLAAVVRQFIARAFDGSPAALAMHALGTGETTQQELADLKALIRKLEQSREEPK